MENYAITRVHLNYLEIADTGYHLRYQRKKNYQISPFLVFNTSCFNEVTVMTLLRV
jgi:hypothetical protein